MIHYLKEELQSSFLEKRFVVLLFALALFLPSFSYNFEVDGIYYNKMWDGTVMVTYKSYSPLFSDYNGDIIIPKQVDYNGATYRVTSIGDWAFYKCSGLTSVTISESVTSISSSAFHGCI